MAPGNGQLIATYEKLVVVTQSPKENQRTCPTQMAEHILPTQTCFYVVVWVTIPYIFDMCNGQVTSFIVP